MAKLFANSEDPDQMPHSAASDQGLPCLPITLVWVSRLQLVNRLSDTSCCHLVVLDKDFLVIFSEATFEIGPFCWQVVELDFFTEKGTESLNACHGELHYNELQVQLLKGRKTRIKFYIKRKINYIQYSFIHNNKNDNVKSHKEP